MVYICPRGSRGGMNYLFFEKSVFVKHPNDDALVVMVTVPESTDDKSDCIHIPKIMTGWFTEM